MFALIQVRKNLQFSVDHEPDCSPAATRSKSCEVKAALQASFHGRYEGKMVFVREYCPPFPPSAPGCAVKVGEVAA